MDGGYISDMANHLKSHGIAVHIGNQGVSALRGSGSYQKSVFVLHDRQYDTAVSLLEKGGYFTNSEDNISKSNKAKVKWYVFLVAWLILLMLASALV